MRTKFILLLILLSLSCANQTMAAGTITVVLLNDTLFIDGDAQDNTVIVEVDSLLNQITVSSPDTISGIATVFGTTEVDTVDILMGSGNDHVVVAAPSVLTPPFEDLIIDGGKNSDEIVIGALVVESIDIFPENGNDHIELINCAATSLRVRQSNGDDNLGVLSCDFDDVNIDLGTDKDCLYIDDSSFDGPFDANTNEQKDITVAIDNQFTGATTSFKGGGDNDKIYLRGNTFTTQLTVNSEVEDQGTIPAPTWSQDCIDFFE